MRIGVLSILSALSISGGYVGDCAAQMRAVRPATALPTPTAIANGLILHIQSIERFSGMSVTPANTATLAAKAAAALELNVVASRAHFPEQVAGGLVLMDVLAHPDRLDRVKSYLNQDTSGSGREAAARLGVLLTDARRDNPSAWVESFSARARSLRRELDMQGDMGTAASHANALFDGSLERRWELFNAGTPVIPGTNLFRPILSHEMMHVIAPLSPAPPTFKPIPGSGLLHVKHRILPDATPPAPLNLSPVNFINPSKPTNVSADSKQMTRLEKFWKQAKAYYDLRVHAPVKLSHSIAAAVWFIAALKLSNTSFGLAMALILGGLVIVISGVQLPEDGKSKQ